MDEGEVEEWLGHYVAAFAAMGRGESSPREVVRFYALPLLLTTDDVVLTMRTADDVETWLHGQAAAMADAGYDHTETVSGESDVLNHSTALHRAVLSRRRADGTEIGRMTVTYLMTGQPDGLRLSALAVHSPT